MNRFTFTSLVVMSTPLFGVSACSAPTPGIVGTGGKGGAQDTDEPAACQESVEVPCMRYHTPLAGNPSLDVALRNKYIAAFGDACYMSEAGSFGCFYQKWQAACDDAVKIGAVSGNAPYDTGYMCQPVAGTDDYSLQIGADVALKIFINYQAAPRQTPLIEINGMPTEVSGPYRNLVEVTPIQSGHDFHGSSGVPNGDGGIIDQQEWILQVNRKNNGGKIRSDLAGFKWECKGSDGGLTTCEEPVFLEDPMSAKKSPFYADTGAQVHHIVPMKDPRCCPWGTNSYKNAAVISGKLNRHFSNNDPPADEVKRLNGAQAYPP